MFPTVVGSIVLAYNLPGIGDNELKLSEKAIAAIFSGEAKYWDDECIVKDNQSSNLPHKLIKVAVRKDESGTTYNFTYYLRKIDYKHFRKASKSFNWKAETIIKAKGSSGMSQQIQENPYSIGYVDFASKQKHYLTAATIQNKEGKWVVPTLQSCAKGAQNASMVKERDFYDIVAYQEGKMSYPLIATSFILLPDEPSSKNREIIRFFNWAFSEGGYIANKNGFSILPEKTINEIRSYWQELLHPQRKIQPLSIR
jgi:phosphate transport system substrate-binding protein